MADGALPVEVPASPTWPAWLRELDGSLAVRAQFVVWGNVRDVYLVPGETRLLPIVEVLYRLLQPSGYEWILVYDVIDGLRAYPHDSQAASRAAQEYLSNLGLSLEPTGASPLTLEGLAGVMRRVSEGGDVRTCLVVDYASRLTQDPQRLEPDERLLFRTAEKLSRIASQVYVSTVSRGALYNPIIWLANREGDLPAWFAAGNDYIRSVSVPVPELGDRLDAAERLAPGFPNGDLDADPRSLSEATKRFAEETEGLGLVAMAKIADLASDRGITLRDVEDTVRSYRVGVLDNPWQQGALRSRLTVEEETIRSRVLGQDQAITKALDIVKRSAMGLSGSQARSTPTRPRGVLFLAGPTGVGKTELAKTLAYLIFGDEQACVRFDMSEFAAEHADARLMGAPPGYIGYEAGGELTNAVRRRPFSLLLFDEVEKAAPRILDKFLQILEDGRLTDGRGSTAYFTDTLIVFTSNLGVYVEDEHGVRQPTFDPADPEPYEQIRERILRGITEHFTQRLQRPELLNRLGDNIVVFDCIRPDIAESIFDGMVDNVAARIADEHGIGLRLAADARKQLLEIATGQLAFGGRGIGSALETALVNPFARLLFEKYDVLPGQQVEILGVQREGMNYVLELA